MLFAGQARLDGAFCDYTGEDKMNFLKRAHARGIVNIEMESLCFAAMCHRAGVKSKTCSIYTLHLHVHALFMLTTSVNKNFTVSSVKQHQHS